MMSKNPDKLQQHVFYPIESIPSGLYTRYIFLLFLLAAACCTTNYVYIYLTKMSNDKNSRSQDDTWRYIRYDIVSTRYCSRYRGFLATSNFSLIGNGQRGGDTCTTENARRHPPIPRRHASMRAVG